MTWGNRKSTPPPPRKTCLLCRKRRCTCRDNPTQPVRETVKITDKRGRDRTVTRKSRTVQVDARGIEWCTACKSRVLNDQCTNVTCRTRQP